MIKEFDENLFDHYRDTGCKHAPKCLSCPLERCVHDVPGLVTLNAARAKKDAERANAVVVAMQTMDRLDAIAKVAQAYGVSRRTIHRILLRVG